MRKVGVWVTQHSKCAALIAVSVVLAIDWIVLDRWSLGGTISAQGSGELLDDVWVLADFSGEQPLISIPYGPHPNHRTSRCMGTRVTRTNRLGRFHFSSLAANRARANKSAFLLVFKPGWIAEMQSAEMSSSVWWRPTPHTRITLRKGPGQRLSTTRRGPGFVWEGLPLDDRFYSDELFGTERVLVEALSACSSEGVALGVVAMNHGLEIAGTFDERDRMRGACRYARKHASGHALWPFDCEALPFKKPVSEAVLAAEAELEAILRKSRSTTVAEPQS